MCKKHEFVIPVFWHDTGHDIHRLEFLLYNQARPLESVFKTQGEGNYWTILGKIGINKYKTLETAKQAVEKDLGIIQIT